MKDRHRRDINAPRTVHPKAVRHHGLFGATFVNQHMMIDNRWSTEDLIDEFEGMAALLSKRMLFYQLESRDNQERMHNKTLDLRKECHDGRIILQRIVSGNNISEMRRMLINNKHLQRLYLKMPVHQAVENINQRTFVMRKERDRLNYRLNQLKEEYRLKLIKRDDIKNRIEYANEFLLNEQKQTMVLGRKIESSNIRLKAIRTINSTYKKIVQVLRHDETFYEPILRSLSSDLDDQANFIKHILYLGLPAIARFKKLREEYEALEDKSRKSVQLKIQIVSNYRKMELAKTVRKTSAKNMVVNMSNLYRRETKNMLNLKANLDAVETAIKQLKIATLSSYAKEIYPRIKSKVENNFKLLKNNQFDYVHHELLAFKKQAAEVFENIVHHSFSQEEERRLERIKELKKQIKAEDVKEENTLAYIKNRTDAFVVLRCTIWNLWDILKYVGRKRKILKIKYPNSYLKLPLLNFDMQTTRAFPPEMFEENVQSLLPSIVKKVCLLMEAYDNLTSQVDPSDIKTSKTSGHSRLWEEYHREFMAVMESDELYEDSTTKSGTDHDMYPPKRGSQSVLNRKQIKTQSARIVELSKMEV